MIILAAPLYAYWQIRNREVPETERFKLSGEGLAARLEARKLARSARGAMLRFIDPKGNERNVPPKDDPLYPIHIMAEDLIAPAVAARASQIELTIGAGGGRVSQTIDGIRYKREPLQPESAAHLIAYLKEIAALNVDDRRRRQTAEFRHGVLEGQQEILDAEAMGGTMRLGAYPCRLRSPESPADTGRVRRARSRWHDSRRSMGSRQRTSLFRNMPRIADGNHRVRSQRVRPRSDQFE